MSQHQPSNDAHPSETRGKRQLNNDLLLRTVRGSVVERPPVWLMRQAGRYLPEYQQIRSNYPNFMDLCRSTLATTELALQPLRRFDLDAAIVFSDILTIPQAMELDLKFHEGIGPRLHKPIREPRDIYQIPFEEILPKVGYVFESVKSLRLALGNRMPVIGFAGSPWTVACYAINGDSQYQFKLAKAFAYEHPVAMQELITQLTQTTARYLEEQAKAGADVLFLIDTWGGLLPFALYDIYVLNSLQTITNHLKSCKIDIPLLFYSKGYSPLHVDKLLKDKPCQGLAIDWTTDLHRTYQDLYGDYAIQGNLDPAILTAGPIATQQHTWDMLERVNPNKRYIASLGHGIVPETPIESVHAFIDTVHSFQKKT